MDDRRGTGSAVSERTRRVAENETTFRRANENLRARISGLAVRDGQEVPFLCECGDRTCFQVVLLLLDEYEAVRDDPNAFLITPGHNDRETEELVSDRSSEDSIPDGGDRFEVVRKRPEVRDITEGSDPRA
jgi:hypothetical protein